MEDKITKYNGHMIQKLQDWQALIGILVVGASGLAWTMQMKADIAANQREAVRMEQANSKHFDKIDSTIEQLTSITAVLVERSGKPRP